ncbi:GMC oxidoreductase [Leptolyngbya sp. 'hensonii']|uniref:GMC oxidoreductase n=1 Tax=Leptolyngbya sp. 'hensonii' TaxID=1922337 RepID=UPI00094FC2B3|nr:GMC family oxidoreductase [Leptolyngbya sp. 'hensonii']OLP18136.1 GMC oxidoreductase [Leptolyngbya sp. 'hensonii']
MNNYPSPEIYDAIVVGSGATGGVAAKELSERGLTVLVLDAGPQLEPEAALGNNLGNTARRFRNLLITRKQSYQALHPGYWKTNPDLFVDETENPYTTPPDQPFYWMRGRQVGGKSLTWGGITLRLSDYEFKAASRDGYGEDWPLTHADLAPYYDRLEQFFQVQGERNGLSQLPDGQYQHPAAFTPAEEYLKTLVADRWPDRSLIISRGFPRHQPNPDKPWPRSSSVGSSLKAALLTGKVSLQPDAVVSHIIFDPQTRQARGVGYIHRVNQTAHEVWGRIVILCASTIESVRILLHSTEQHQSGGLVNESGLLGRYLMDHISTMSFFTLPSFKQPSPPFELSGCDSFFIPRFSNLQPQEESFLRGYGLWGGVQRFSIPHVVRKFGDSALGFLVGHGEVLPRYENQVQLDPMVVDTWGIPVAHIDCSWSDNEHQMLAHMQSQIQELVDLAGGQCLRLTELLKAPAYPRALRQLEETVMFAAPPGFYIHEVGGARMGTSPTNSVLNPYNQCWEAPNLLVVDGACWPSAGWQNPTLTEMAITARACEFIINSLK